jgi:hypothetical protein
VSSIEWKIINVFRKVTRVVKLSTGIIGLECPIKVHGETQYTLKGHRQGHCMFHINKHLAITLMTLLDNLHE